MGDLAGVSSCLRFFLEFFMAGSGFIIFLEVLAGRCGDLVIFLECFANFCFLLGGVVVVGDLCSSLGWLDFSWSGIISISLEYSVLRNWLVSFSSPLVWNWSSSGFIIAWPGVDSAPP